MCIIQDSDVDWQREALQMYEIYKQGFLNISADSAADAREGLFRRRSSMVVRPLKLHMPRIGETIYLTLDERNMFQWVNDAPLSERATGLPGKTTRAAGFALHREGDCMGILRQSTILRQRDISYRRTT